MSTEHRAPEHGGLDPSSRTDQELRVLVVADPGFTEATLRRAGHDLERELQAVSSDPVTLEVEGRFIRLRPDRTLDPGFAVEVAREHERVDVVVLLTEMPRHVDGHALICEVFPEQQVAVVSFSALGVWGLRTRLVRMVVEAVCALEAPGVDCESRRALPRWCHWADRPDGGRVLRTSALQGNVRMVAGMVMSNQPWRTAPRLSKVLAAASATGAFGIFYSSIWQMSDALMWWRLLVSGVLAVGLMVWWLIFSAGLWDTAPRRELRTLTWLYNLSTVVTLTACVLALYAVLFLGILLASLVVIAPGFMTDVLGYPADFLNYLKIAWFSAAMGVIAGALGSSFDDRTDLRSVTHGQRERQRVILDDDGDDGDDATGA